MARRGAKRSTKNARPTSPVRCAVAARRGKSLRKRMPSGSTKPIAAANFRSLAVSHFLFPRRFSSGIAPGDAAERQAFADVSGALVQIAVDRTQLARAVQPRDG